MLIDQVNVGDRLYYTDNIKNIIDSRKNVDIVEVLELSRISLTLLESDLVTVKCVITGETFKTDVSNIQPDPAKLKEKYDEYILFCKIAGMQPLEFNTISRTGTCLYWGRRGNIIHAIDSKGILSGYHVMWIPELKDTEDLELSKIERQRNERNRINMEYLSWGTNPIMPKLGSNIGRFITI